MDMPGEKDDKTDSALDLPPPSCPGDDAPQKNKNADNTSSSTSFDLVNTTTMTTTEMNREDMSGRKRKSDAHSISEPLQHQDGPDMQQSSSIKKAKLDLDVKVESGDISMFDTTGDSLMKKKRLLSDADVQHKHRKRTKSLLQNVLDQVTFLHFLF